MEMPPILRPFQATAIQALENPGAVICVSPTGSGKSLIYERFAQRAGTRMILVTPLIALARQQRARLERAGVRAALGAGPEPEAPPPGGSGTWIASPESLLFPGRRDALARWKPGILVVDECHCLWDWGEGFRPAFREIPALPRALPSIERSLWLTATLPMAARAELRAALGDSVRELGGFELPPSLAIAIRRTAWMDRADALLAWLARREGAGIVFVQTRSSALRVARLVAPLGRRTAVYHAGMSSEERRATERAIGRREPAVIVATSAFGMGMDHPHLRWIALWQAPRSLLALTQALGRAGRGERDSAQALVLWDDDDFRLLETGAELSVRAREELLQTREFLNAMKCRRSTLHRYFEGRDASGFCGRCDVCNPSEAL